MFFREKGVIEKPKMLQGLLAKKKGIHNARFCQGFMPNLLTKLVVNATDLYLHIKPKELHEVVNILKKNTYLSANTLLDIVASDHYGSGGNRFGLCYILTNLTYNHRFFIIFSVHELTPIISVNFLYSSAGWYERECWDLFGVFFFKNPDMRRLLTEYGFHGSPLRKEFPVFGMDELYYNVEEFRVWLRYASLSQADRLAKSEGQWF